ncbi:hypothetical protein QQ020_22995 [Fulvivirgaceae bacterium BMA12]|uniref:Uncharacterized protein n=1 Tax=Agaribacillus aureus TaxID=3051825 RepID=A0ABT8LCM9_9BACT|nr:hypothetical protein [Fulvivirgaceae bacterium BMA12]
MQNSVKYCLLLFLLISCAQIQTEAQTVYITKTGRKYHKETCRYLNHSKYPLTLSKAKERGYEACKVCKPATKTTGAKVDSDSTKIIVSPTPPKVVKAVRCSAKTRSTGSRCKRMTKNANGKCWQHQ